MREPKVKWIFVLPAVTYILVITIFPLVWSLSLAFTDWKLTRASEPQFVGIQNFERLLMNDKRFGNALSFTALYVSIATLVELALGLALALILHSKTRGARVMRIFFLIPLAVPPIGTAFMWRMLLQEDVGLVNAALSLLNIGKIRWFTDPWTARLGLIMIDIWQWTPFMFLALLAAISAIPAEPQEAALIDGATRWGVIRHVVLPLISPVIITIVLIRCIDAFKLFDYVYGVTGGGPGTTTESASYYIYLLGRVYFDLGYASSASYILLIIMLGLSTIILWRLRRTW